VIEGDTVSNPQLADPHRALLSLNDRNALRERQEGTRWAQLLEEGDVIILATAVFKRRHLSVKRRQLLLIDNVGGPRIFYVDPDTTEVKGDIPWDDLLLAEMLRRGHFQIILPWRTYYLEDCEGSEQTAELWVRTLLNLKARRALQREAAASAR